MTEHHVNHVADVCSADCRPAPEWLRAQRDRALAENAELRARLADAEAERDRKHVAAKRLRAERDRLRQICANAIDMGIEHDDVSAVLEVLDAANVEHLRANSPECVLLYGDGPDAPSFCECRNCTPRAAARREGER